MPRPQNSAKTPEQLELDMQIDLLVDNELPQDERRALLQKCEQQGGQWRTLAVRFLERQTEHKVVRDLISGKTQESEYDAPPIFAFKMPFGIDVRTAAAVLLIAVGAGSMGMYYGQRNTGGMIAGRPTAPGNNIAGANIMGGGSTAVAYNPDRRNVQFDDHPLTSENASTLEAMITGQNPAMMAGPHNVIIMPQDHHQALVVPVSLDRTQAIY